MALGGGGGGGGGGGEGCLSSLIEIGIELGYQVIHRS